MATETELMSEAVRTMTQAMAVSGEAAERLTAVLQQSQAEATELRRLYAEACDENAALRAALAANHRQHYGAVESLTNLLGAVVLKFDGDPLTLSADFIAGAHSLGLVDFDETEDGDVTVFFPPTAEELAAGVVHPLGVVAETVASPAA